MKSKIFLSLILVVSFLVNSASPIFASEDNLNENLNSYLDKAHTEDEQERILKHIEQLKNEASMQNHSSLSTNETSLAQKAFENPEENVYIADIVNGKTVLSYETNKDDVWVSVTDGETVEVIEQIGDSAYLINGEKHNVEVKSEIIEGEKQVSEYNKLEDVSPLSSWTEISHRPTDNWEHIGKRQHQIIADKYFAEFTSGALTSILSSQLALIFGGNPILWAVAGAAAGALLAMAVADSSYEGEVVTYEYEHDADRPLYRQVNAHSYILDGTDLKFAGIDTTYYTWSPCPGC